VKIIGSTYREKNVEDGTIQSWVLEAQHGAADALQFAQMPSLTLKRQDFCLRCSLLFLRSFEFFIHVRI
jgi:hypothetical protein